MPLISALEKESQVDLYETENNQIYHNKFQANQDT